MDHYRAAAILPASYQESPMYAPENSCPRCTLPVEQAMMLLNTLDPIVSKLKLLGDLSPLVDDSPIVDKGRVAIGLLEIVADYVEQLDGALTMFANRLPRPRVLGEDAR
jgi:hypothetical protein